ncbi:sensor histidine kinase [Alteromonas sp. CYL-A6]|uniref:sensor histidine kinase n=1 Tax=Alteromonas nitratireducens TaxID=3390813 RepID=UPI0034B48C84
MNEKLLLNAISVAQSQYINQLSANELFNDMLVSLLELTESEYGFIGEIRHGEDGVPFLKTFALTNIAWNDETRKFYEENAPFGLEFRNLNTLFGHVISSGQRVISNQPASDPRAGGLPPGHPDLRHFMGLPFYLSDTFIGMAGIANRKGGYTDEIADFLEPLMKTCAQLIAAYQVDQKNKQMVESLRLLKEEAEQANLAKSEFLANMNHEIRTPLHGIQGTAELIQEYFTANYNDDHKLQMFIENVITSSKHLSNIVSDTLDLAKIESGTVTVVWEKFGVEEIIQDAVSMLRSLADEQNTQIIFESPDEQILLESDKQKCKQIVVNLMSNAVKFTENGIVNITVARVNKPNGPHIIITVTDSGIGIEASHLEVIFEPFRQADSSSTKRYAGTGLGLSITKRFVELLGGSISVESRKNHGSKFTVTLPVKGQ